MAQKHWIDYLYAATVVIAIGGLFVGRVMIYPVATASGSFLERVAAERIAWDSGHLWMLVGIVAMIPAAIGLRRVLRARAPWLVDAGAALVIIGAALTVGQFALDFAMSAAARLEPPEAGTQFVSLLRADPVVDWAFYKLTEVGQLGLLLFTIALWRQGSGWRLQAAIVTLAAALFLCGPWLGAIGIRVALGLLFAGFVTVAWKMASAPPPEASGS